MNRNPFYIKELSVTAPFCDRKHELKELTSHALNNTNVVLFSPRRYGKTSLCKRVQAALSKQGALTAYCDFFGITSEDEIASRIAKALYKTAYKNESVFKQATKLITSFQPVLATDHTGSFSITVQPTWQKHGVSLLDDTMQALENFINTLDIPVHIALDEFQEITEVEQGISVEGVLRHYIQSTNCSIFFIGSRRRVLLDIFNQRKRPFFQSTINYELKPLPKNNAIQFIITQFSKNGKTIATEQAERIVTMIAQHPYYMQKICFILFNQTEKHVDNKQIINAKQLLLENEKYVFESILQGLKPAQIGLLCAIAKEYKPKIFSTEFMRKYELRSTGGAQKNLKTLVALDLIEKHHPTKHWQIVDPIFHQWLVENF